MSGKLWKEAQQLKTVYRPWSSGAQLRAKYMKKLIVIIITFIFMFNGTGYCLRTPLEFGEKDNFSSRLEAALQSVHRKDRSQDIRDSLKNQERFLEELQKASVSALDYLIFVSELLFMSRTNLRDEMNLLSMVKRVEFPMSDSLSPLIERLSKDIFTDISEKTYLSNDKKIFYYDSAFGAAYKPVGPEGSITAKEQPEILHKILFANSPEAFLIPTLQAAARDENIKTEDIAYPLKAVHFQSGTRQDVYLILVTLKDKRVIPFTLSVARSSDTSDIVRHEFENFKAHFGDSDVIQAFSLTSIDGFSAYSSAFENDIAEIQYNTNAMASLLMERAGSFRLNSNLPLRSGSLGVPTFFKMVKQARQGTLELPDFSKILIGAVGLVAKFYDPDTKTMIDDFDIQSGDVNMNDSANIKDSIGVRSISPSVDLSFKLIAWRGNKAGVDIPHFLDYLFGISYISGEKKHIVRGDNFDPLIIAGVLEGLKQGLIKKYGLAKGLQETKAWMEMYLSAIGKNLLEEDGLFSKAILNLYLESLDSEIKDNAKRDDFLNKLINQMSPLSPAIEITEDVVSKAEAARQMYARYKSLLELLETYSYSSHYDFPVNGRRLHGKVLRRICAGEFIDLKEKVEGLELETSNDIAEWAQLYPQLNTIIGRIEYHAETAVLSLKNEIKRAGDLIDSLSLINEKLASKLELGRRKLSKRCAEIMTSDNPYSEYEGVSVDIEIIKLKAGEAMERSESVVSDLQIQRSL